MKERCPGNCCSGSIEWTVAGTDTLIQVMPNRLGISNSNGMLVGQLAMAYARRGLPALTVQMNRTTSPFELQNDGPG